MTQIQNGATCLVFVKLELGKQHVCLPLLMALHLAGMLERTYSQLPRGFDAPAKV